VDAQTADYIATGLDADDLLDLAARLREFPPRLLRRLEVEWEADSANLSEPLDRVPLAHAGLQMIRGARCGVDPGEIAAVYLRWKALPDRQDRRGDEFLRNGGA
jgi:hypothetical protein